MHPVSRVVLFVIGYATLGAALVQASPARSAVALPTDPLTIDGNLNEPAWLAGDWSAGFTDYQQVHLLADPATRVKVRHDDRFVYFGIACDEPDIAEIKAEVRPHDDVRIYNQDSIELMLHSHPDRDEYFHYIINAEASVYDARVVDYGRKELSHWDGILACAAAKSEKAWYLEIAVPLGELPIRLTDPAHWRFNVCRNRMIEGREQRSTFAPLISSYHQPTLFAGLHMQRADFASYRWDISEPVGVKVLAEQDRLLMSCRVLAANRTGRFKFVGMEFTSDLSPAGSPPAEAEGGLDEGQSSPFAVQGLPVRNGHGLLRVRLFDRTRPEHTLASRAFPLKIAYTPLALRVRRPFYRNNIYATETLDAIVVDVEAQLPAEELSGRTYRLELRDSSDALIGHVTTNAAGEVRMVLPIPGLPVGDYVLGVVLAGTDHGVETPLRKLPAVAHEWRIGECGNLLHNGRPFIAFGSIANPMTPEAVACGQNITFGWSPPAWIPRYAKQLDRLAELGMYRPIYPYRSPSLRTIQRERQPLSNEEAVEIREHVGVLQKYPAVLAYYTFDEPMSHVTLPERAEAVYDICRETDPCHPVMMIMQRPEGTAVFRDALDIVSPDPYPGFLYRAGPARDISMTTGRMRAAQSLKRDNQVMWCTIQTFNYQLGQGHKGHRHPYFSEIRNQVYQAFIVGAKGIMAYFRQWSFPDNAEGMRFCASEVRALYPALVAKDAPGLVEAMGERGDQTVHASARRNGGHLYLLTCSTATEPQDITFTLRDENPPDALIVVSENRRVSVKNGTFTDRFGYCGVHIYTTDATLADRPTVAAAQAEIDRLSGPKPGNLLHETTGATATTSHVSRKQRPNQVNYLAIDGLTFDEPCRVGWVNDMRSPLPQWLQVTMTQPAPIGRVVLYTTNVGACDIVLRSGGEWVNVGTLHPANDNPPAPQNTLTLDRSVVADAVRVTVTRRLNQDNPEGYIMINEVEAYAE